MEHRIISNTGPMVCHCIRLKRGEDLMESIKAVCARKDIRAGVVLSGVGFILRGRVRDASGVNIREIDDHCEIVSLNGTVSAKRCHIHIALYNGKRGKRKMKNFFYIYYPVHQLVIYLLSLL